MLFAITEAISSIRDFMEQGGTVLWLIAFLVFFMWGMIFERIWYLSHAYQDYISGLANKWNSRKDKKRKARVRTKNVRMRTQRRRGLYLTATA